MYKFNCKNCNLEDIPTSSKPVANKSLCFDCEKEIRDLKYQEKLKRERRKRKQRKPKKVTVKKCKVTWLCCGNPECHNSFIRRNWQHTYCSPDCRPHCETGTYNKSPYYKKVWKLTKELNLESLPNSENRGWRDYHLDHIVPISYGESQNIPPELIGSIQNVQFMWWKDNYEKNDNLTTKSLQLLTEWGYPSVE